MKISGTSHFHAVRAAITPLPAQANLSQSSKRQSHLGARP